MRNVQNVVETNLHHPIKYVRTYMYVDLDGVHNRTFICPRKKKRNIKKKSSELGTTSDLVVVHTLICSLKGVFLGLRN